MIEYQERWIADFNRRFEEINADRAKAQELLAEPMGTIAELAQRFSIVSRDRADAQLVMDDQFAQIQKMHAKLTEQKQALTVAKSACRNKGRCFVVPKDLNRAGRSQNASRANSREFRASCGEYFCLNRSHQKRKLRGARLKMITQSVTEHEPAAGDLEKQRAESSTWDRRPKISLLIPLLDAPANFLDELFASILSANIRQLGNVRRGCWVHKPRNGRFATPLDQNRLAYSRTTN